MGYEKFLIYIVAGITIVEVFVRKFFPNYVKYFILSLKNTNKQS